MNNKKIRVLVHMLEWLTAATASSSEEMDNIFILSICEVISNCSAKKWPEYRWSYDRSAIYNS